MKHLSNAVANCNIKKFALSFFPQSKKNTTSLLCLMLLCGTFLFTSCKQQDISEPKSEAATAGNDQSNFDLQSGTKNLATLRELAAARAATEKYKNIDSAFADGYIDINVVMPNMGYHFQKSGLVDSVFDFRHPEFLVYNKRADSTFQLVALEYGIPLFQSEDAPEGFAGSQDVWDHNDEFGLWLLHAWIWKYNPDGIFNPTNPKVIVQ